MTFKPDGEHAFDHEAVSSRGTIEHMDEGEVAYIGSDSVEFVGVPGAKGKKLPYVCTGHFIPEHDSEWVAVMKTQNGYVLDFRHMEAPKNSRFESSGEIPAAYRAVAPSAYVFSDLRTGRSARKGSADAMEDLKRLRTQVDRDIKNQEIRNHIEGMNETLRGLGGAALETALSLVPHPAVAPAARVAAGMGKLAHGTAKLVRKIT